MGMDEAALLAERERCKQYYWANRERIRERHRKRQFDRRQYLSRIKLERGCVDCGYNTHPAALDFDHIDPSIKSGTINRFKIFSWKRLHDELAKCEVRCSNCHRIKTFEERGLEL